MNMTKFGALDDPGFIAVAGEIRRWVKALNATQGGLQHGSKTAFNEEELIEARKRLQESESLAKEELRRVQVDHAAELKMQRLILRREVKEHYRQVMHERLCNVM